MEAKAISILNAHRTMAISTLWRVRKHQVEAPAVVIEQRIALLDRRGRSANAM